MQKKKLLKLNVDTVKVLTEQEKKGAVGGLMPWSD